MTIDRYCIVPATGPIRGQIRPPGSKSITNRALVCAALAEGTSTLLGALASEDTAVMVEALRKLGIAIDSDAAAARLQVAGCHGRLPATSAQLQVANSGTTIRFLTALTSLGQGEYRIDGSPRMRQRPIQDLLDALGQLGVDAESERRTGCPPVVVRAHGLQGGRAVVRGDVSSQFLSGLLMAAPFARTPLELEVDGPLVSAPYVRMTLAVMRAFGVEVACDERLRRFSLPTACYRGRTYAIEPDASAASYFFAAAAITGGEVTVRGLSRESLQGDVLFCERLKQMGCRLRFERDAITVTGGPLRGIETNMSDVSDTAQTLASVALFAEGATTITGIGHNRFKETDRIAALATELRKLGAEVTERDDGLTIAPAPLHGAEIETYQDHRMAMSLSLVGLRVQGVTILDPRCVDKTYPAFFADLEALKQAPPEN